MPWNHFFPWIFLSCFLLVQSFWNSEFSPSDWFFAFELDLKTGIGFGRSKTLYKFLTLILWNLNILIEVLDCIIFQLIILEEGEHLSCSLSQCIYFGETLSHRQGKNLLVDEINYILLGSALYLSTQLSSPVLFRWRVNYF
jgi:hypothetical protein